MQKMRTAVIVLGLVLAVPLAGLAAPKPTHLTQGVVKSIDSNSLVIEQGAGKKKKDVTFTLNATTHREGDVNNGSTVTVRYTNEGSKLTAVDVQPVKSKAAGHKPAAH